jgi:agmatine deiminase
VNLLVDDVNAEQAVRRRCTFPGAENIRCHPIPTVDSWIRDYGANFLINETGGLAYNDWIFNAWGNKYEDLKKDDSIPARLEDLLKVPRFEPGIVMEGGSIEVNGAGCVLTTEQCLLNTNRNPDLSKEEIEEYLKDYLGVQKVLWLGEGIVGDDTDGHIDDIARFVAPEVIICAVEDDPLDANYEILQDNLKQLQSLTDAKGRSFEIVMLPMPGVVGGTSTDNRNLDRLPASYANFYIANGIVLAPVFGHANDTRALQTLQRLFPGRRVVGINCEPLVWGMGAIHCVTQQQPAT